MRLEKVGEVYSDGEGNEYEYSECKGWRMCPYPMKWSGMHLDREKELEKQRKTLIKKKGKDNDKRGH